MMHGPINIRFIWTLNFTSYSDGRIFFLGVEKYTLFVKYPGFHYLCFHGYYCICISVKASSSSNTVVACACGGRNVLTFVEEESLS